MTTTEMEYARPIYEIGEFRGSTLSTDTQINVFVSDKRLKIDLFTSTFESSPSLLAVYLRHVRRQEGGWTSKDDPDFDLNGEFADPLEEMHDWILQPFLPIMNEIAPLNPSQKYTLQDCLFSEEFHYMVHIAGDQIIPVYLDTTQDTKSHSIGESLPSSVDYSMLHVYHPRDIKIPIKEDSTWLGLPHKVFIPGRTQPSFFKIAIWGDVDMMTREIHSYTKIRAAHFDPPILTSQLEGLVRDDSGYILGLLFSYIPRGRSSLFPCDREDPQFPSLRRKWVDQIWRTIKQLHSQNIIWGNAKESNVLVDINDDAYLIDFGGGLGTQEKSNSIEGDLEGFEAIKECLFE